MSEPSTSQPDPAVAATPAAPRLLQGRYLLHGEIAAGGMATVHLARQVGSRGFSRTVAIKRMHAHLAKDTELTAMFLDEARIAARIRHPNVVPTLDVVAADDDLFLVMEYVQGESLARLLRHARRQSERIPVAVASAVMVNALHGLHAAHEARDEQGDPLEIVHRDVSPQNILVGIDGVSRVLDFGVAKALGRAHVTRDGQVKGKLGYMPPEQLRGEPVTRHADVYGAGVVLWEALTGERLFVGDNEGITMAKVFQGAVAPPSSLVPEVPESVDAVVLRALHREASLRFSSAREMALALERAMPPATPTEVAAWLEHMAGDLLAERANALALVERGDSPSAAAIASTQPSASVAEPFPQSVSSLSVTSDAQRPSPARPRTRLVVALLGASAGLALLATFVFARGGQADDRERGDQALRTAAASASAAVAPSESAAPIQPTPTAAPAKSVLPAVPATATAERTLRKVPPKPPVTSGGDKCNPKYTVDADGTHRIKPHCLNAP